MDDSTAETRNINETLSHESSTTADNHRTDLQGVVAYRWPLVIKLSSNVVRQHKGNTGRCRTSSSEKRNGVISYYDNMEHISGYKL